MLPWRADGTCRTCGDRVIARAKGQTDRTAVRRDRGRLPAKQGPSGPRPRDGPSTPDLLAERSAAPLGSGVRAAPERRTVRHEAMHPTKLEPAPLSAQAGRGHWEWERKDGIETPR
jgi:hypothetical protein